MYFLRRRLLLGTSVAALMISAGAAVSGAQTLATGESDALSIDFTDDFFQSTTSLYGSAYVVDTGTPANDYDSHPYGLLTYTFPSAKYCLQADGTYKLGAHNLCLQSEDFTNASWININTTDTANQATDPNGGSGMDLITTTVSNGKIQQNITVEAGSIFSFYLRPGTGTTVIVDNGAAGANDTTDFVLTGDGSYTLRANNSAASISHVGGGLYYCTVTRGSTAGNRVSFATATSGHTFYVWGAHLRRTPSVDTYMATTTAARYALPYEWDSGGNLLGIRVEEARTNLLTYSNDLTNAAWTKSNMTTAKTATGPGGDTNGATTCTASANNAIAFQEVTSTSAARAGQVLLKRRTGTGAVSIAIGETTGSELNSNSDFSTNDTSPWSRGFNSVDGTLDMSGGNLVHTVGAGDGATPRWVKAITGLTAGKLYRLSVGTLTTTGSTGTFLVCPNSNGTGAVAFFSAPNGGVKAFVATASTMYISITTSGTTGQTTTVDDVSILEVAESTVDLSGGGWVRATIENKTITDPCMAIKLATSGDAVDVALAGVESGAFATSPIETISATATRAADNISLATSAFPYSATAGTVYVQYSLIGQKSSQTPWAMTTGANTDTWRAYAAGTNIAMVAIDEGVTQANFTAGGGGCVVGTTYNLAGAAATNDYALVLDGGAVQTDPSGTVEMSENTLLQIGSTANGNDVLNGYIKKLMYLPRRMSNADMQTLTT